MRIANRLLAFVVSVALIAASILLIVEVIAARSNAEPLIVHWDAIRRWGERNTWRATSVKLAAVITLVAGLALLLPQLRRRRSKRMDIDTSPSDTRPSDTRPSDTRPSDTRPSDTRPSDTRPSDTRPSTTTASTTTPTPTANSSVQATLTRKSVAQAVRSAVEDVDTITTSKVRVRKRAVVVAAESSSLDPEVARGLIAQVEDAANGQLAALRLIDPPRVKASVGYRGAGRV